MILADAQQQALSRELERLTGYGRTEVEFHETGRRVRPPLGSVVFRFYGYVVIKQWGWKPTGRRGWALREEIRIGGRGKITREVHDRDVATALNAVGSR